MKKTHGGSRPNSGAKPKGNILYQRRFRPELVKKMDEYLTKLKEEYGNNKTKM